MKHIKTNILASALVLGILFNGAVEAKFLGPDTSTTYANVSDVLRNPIEGERVALTGNIIKKIGHHTYLFKDSSGEIPVVISDIMLAFYRDFSQKNKITVQAEIDVKGSDKPELIAKSLHIDN